jgi:hypothetical protein
MTIDRGRLERRKERDPHNTQLLGSPPYDEFRSLRLVWECTDVHSDGSPCQFESDAVAEWCVVRHGKSWAVRAKNDGLEKSRTEGTRVFRSPPAAAKWIEDTKT